MVELTPEQVASLPKATVISRLRFIPKTDGMRPITRVMGADTKTRVHFNCSLNLHHYVLCGVACCECVHIFSSAALPKPCPGLAECAAGLRALQPFPAGLHSVGDD